MALWRHKRYDLLLFFAAFLAVTLPVIYIFLVSIARYLEPLIPILALIAGYGLFTLIITCRKQKIIIVLIAAALCIYLGALYGRYIVMLCRNDTRLEARAWGVGKPAPQADLIVDSQPVRFVGTGEAVTLMQKLDPSALRAADTSMLRDSSHMDQFNSYNIYLVSSSTQQKVLEGILAQNNPDTYLLTDSWTDISVLQPYLLHAELVKSFSTERPCRYLPASISEVKGTPTMASMCCNCCGVPAISAPPSTYPNSPTPTKW